MNGADNGGVTQKDGRERKTLFNPKPAGGCRSKERAIKYFVLLNYFDHDVFEWHVVRCSHYVVKYL